MKILFQALFTVLICFSFTTAKAHAAENFENRLVTTYTVTDTGATTISHQFKIKNLSPTIFLKQYSLSLFATQLSDVQVEYKQKKIDPVITTVGTATTVLISFPDDVVGEGKERIFTISYQSIELAQRAGKVLEVQIPPLSTDEHYVEHTIFLKTPFLFGSPVRVSPQPKQSLLDGEFISTQFDAITNSPIVAIFGTEQLFKMTLRYNLENSSSNPGFIQIALPPDTSFQRMSYVSLEPPTNDMRVDADGNWIATYHLPAHTTQPVYLTATVKTTLNKNEAVPVTAPNSDHFSEQKYWEADSEVKRISGQQAGVSALYDFVVNTLKYSYDAVEQGEILPRLGASGALAQPTQAVCQEFTDLFVSLARSQGIAARRLTGYAYTQNKALKPLSFAADVLHAWPDYFDESTQLWRQVDPTWQNTTGGVDYFHQFDLNHIVFAINGISSTLPYPAGSYKAEKIASQDISVELTDSYENEVPTFALSLTPQKVFGLFIPGLYTLSVSNKTGFAWYNAQVDLVSTNGLQVSPLTQELPALLPFQTIDIPIHIYPQTGCSMDKATLTTVVSLSPQEYEKAEKFNITSGPRFFKYLTDQTRIISVAAGAGIIAISAWGLLVFKRKR